MSHLFGTIEVRPCELWEWEDTGERYVEETTDDGAQFWEFISRFQTVV